MYRLILLATSICFGTFAQGANVVINAGFDSLPDGPIANPGSPTDPVADGRLVQLFVSTTDDVMDPPSGTDFLGGDDVLIGSGPVDSFFGTFPGGGTIATATLSTPTGSGIDGDELVYLRWWPTVNSGDSRVTGTEPYVQVELPGRFPTTDGTFGGAQGFSVDAAALAQNANADGLGYTLVPEPSSVGLLMIGFLSLFVRRRR